MHVQNKRFRYSIDEQGFVDLAASILRAKSEIDFYRTNPPKFRLSKDFTRKFNPSEKIPSTACNLALDFDDNGIDYRFIESGKRYATFIINDNNYDDYISLLNSRNIPRFEHPYGKLFGYKFLYNMRPFQLVKLDDTYCEIFFQLPCMSLIPKNWMPLDKFIQALVWNSHDISDNIQVLNPICLYIYRLCYAIFKDVGFSGYTCGILKAHKNLLYDEIFCACVEKVFFKFSVELINLLRDEKFDDVIPSYYKFSQY